MPIIDPNQLCTEFQAHVRDLPSTPLVASEATSFESWFRVELGITLIQRLGVQRAKLIYNYNYPTPTNQKRKADICIESETPIVFELKTFSEGADANKLQKFPGQNQLLREHVVGGHFRQGVSFATFFGYSERRLQTIIGKLYPPEAHWNISGPHALLEGFCLVFVVAVTEETSD